jgi:hypothetical protein
VGWLVVRLFKVGGMGGKGGNDGGAIPRGIEADRAGSGVEGFGVVSGVLFLYGN